MSMHISGEQIREARERLHMTQQDLADVVGVSLRTVGNWERGESVPRNRTGAMMEALGLESPRDEMLAKLGRLAERRRGQIGMGRIPFAKAADIGGDKTVAAFEQGKTLPWASTQANLEKALGWRPGIIADTVAAYKAGRISVDEVTDEYLTVEPTPPPVPVSRASELPDSELIAEVLLRLSRWQLERGEANNVHTIDFASFAGRGRSAPLLSAASNDPGDDAVDDI